MRIDKTHAPSRNGEIPSLIRTLTALVETLAPEVDDAYERGDASAEDQDARLAELREQLASVEAEFDECEGDCDLEDNGDMEPPDYHEGIGIEEQLICAYAHYLRSEVSVCFAGSRRNLVEHMRRVIEDGVGGPITASDSQIVSAARDVYDAEVDRRSRRHRKTLHC